MSSTVFGFEPADLVTEGMPAKAARGCAFPLDDFTWLIAASNNKGDYETRHDGTSVTGCNCLGGIHGQSCQHMVRLQWHLDLRAARLAREQRERERAHFVNHTSLNGDRAFNMLRR